MKCANCGAELRTGCLFCSSCGKEAQIVPDYNVLDDDDYINSLVNDTEAQKAKASEEQQRRLKEKKAAIQEKKRKKRLIVSLIIVFVVAIVTVILVSFCVKDNRNNSFDYQYKQAQQAYDNGDLKAATAYYERALQLEPESLKTMLALGRIYMETKDYKSALVLYSDYIRLDNKNTEAYANLITIYEDEQDYEGILALMDTTDYPAVLKLFDAYLVDSVKFSVAGGSYEDYFDVELLTGDNCSILYTLDGGDPTTSGLSYSSPIALDKEGEYLIKAVSVNSKGLYGDVAQVKYVITIPTPDMPEVSPDGGSFTQETKVYVSVPAGCTAYYTWDSTDPTTASTKYTGVIDIPEGNNILSVIIYDDETGKYSGIYRGNFVYYAE